jgi:hypothetical protein
MVIPAGPRKSFGLVPLFGVSGSSVPIHVAAPLS